jgi:hypothetical protein
VDVVNVLTDLKNHGLAFRSSTELNLAVTS